MLKNKHADFTALVQAFNKFNGLNIEVLPRKFLCDTKKVCKAMFLAMLGLLVFVMLMAVFVSVLKIEPIQKKNPERLRLMWYLDQTDELEFLELLKKQLGRGSIQKKGASKPLARRFTVDSFAGVKKRIN